MLSRNTKARRSGRPDVAIVGTGQLARVLAHALHDAGYKIHEIVSRDLPESKQRVRGLARQVKTTATVFASAAFNASVIWLCIPDDLVSYYARAITETKANWAGQIMVHSSGALSSTELEPFRRAGGSIVSAHPLMSFVLNSPATLKNVPIALEGEAKAIAVLRPVLRHMRAPVFEIEENRKPAYHAFGAFASPLLIAFLTQMEAAGVLAGLERKEARERAAGILQQTLTNYIQKGPAKAFSGPLRRGDVGTIQKHLQALQQDAKLSDFYRG